MKIYFAGSIRGGRDDRALYLDLIQFLQQFGEVLTEHVGDQHLSVYGEDQLTDQGIYERDMEWLRSCDVVVAEVTTPSLGVGYELGKAEDLGKTILCLYRKQPGKRLSAMLNGNSNVLNKTYQTREEAFEILSNFFKG
ncbi:MAG: nucleoside 2-deoxyribosyltransferase [Bacteroidetes bacterium]|nr:MAG: nucleoside 2-deoxyribosyltransferase [Bacteroidota bacterium]